MPWTHWQKVEANAHAHFNAKKPTADELREYLHKDAGFVDDPRLLDALVNLILAGWEGFDSLQEPQSK